MFTRRRKILLIRVAIIAAGLSLSLFEVWQDRHQRAQYITATNSADAARLRNTRLVMDAQSAVFWQGPLNSRAARTTQTPRTVDQVRAILLPMGITLLPSTMPSSGPAGERVERYSMTRVEPAGEAWIEFVDGRFTNRVGAQFVAASPAPRLQNVTQILRVLHPWSLIAWVVLCFMCLRAGRRRRLVYSQALTAIALFCVLSTLGRWRILSWDGLVDGSGPGLWMLLLIVSLILMYLIRRRQGQVDLRFCSSCRYDLWGNQSGRCPECGVEIPVVQRVYLSGIEGESRTSTQES